MKRIPDRTVASGWVLLLATLWQVFMPRLP